MKVEDNEGEDEVMAEIRRTRELLYREAGGDVQVLFDQIRQDTERFRAEGWQIVDLESPSANVAVHEDPPI